MIQEFNSLPKFAVCIAAFNGVNWLPEQIESIFKQVNIAVTIFISVDSSSDGTEAWVNQALERDSRIVVLAHGRRFGGAAPNFFRLMSEIDFSKFDYISFADQDDIWLPDKLWHAHETLLKTKAHAYSSNVIAFWPDGRKVLVEKSQKQVQWDFLFEAAGPGCTYVMRQDLACAVQLLLKNRLIDIQRVGLHDWLIYAFARANGYLWVIDDYPGMLYRQHEKNQVGVNLGWRALWHRAHKILSGWGLAQSVLIAELIGLENNFFVRRWSGGSRMGMFWLAFHAWQCRRRLRDKILFALSCLALGILGKYRL